ncbi:hypothetical protein EB118_14235 [bacterium]|nr:hypothetical protein [bacterium]
MEINKLIFFNHWRNGDVFINREYVKYFINKIDAPAYYAHNNHFSTTQDLPCELIKMEQLPYACMNTFMKKGYDAEKKTLYINTWVGAWIGQYLNHGEHANFMTLRRIWNDLHQSVFKTDIVGNHFDFLPTITYKSTDANYIIANAWCDKHKNHKIVMFCNGKQHSEQSDMGDMKRIIDIITSDYSEILFVVCDKLNLKKNNIVYTDDIFGSSVGNLPHISYISTFADKIIGKNSGPFSYAHTRANNQDAQKTFFCFSKEMKSCLTGEGKYYAKHCFSDTIDDDVAIQLLINELETYEYNPNLKPIRHVHL